MFSKKKSKAAATSVAQEGGEKPEAQQPKAETATAAKKTVSQVMGEITWLLTQSPIHKQLFIGDLEWFAMPPVLLEQFRIFHGKDHPVGVALWARVSDETDARLRNGAFKLRPDEWKNGNKPWLVELVAPFGGQEEMMVDLSAALFPDEPFSYHHVGSDGARKVVQYVPKSVHS